MKKGVTSGPKRPISPAAAEGLARFRSGKGYSYVEVAPDEVQVPFEERKRLESPYRIAINKMIAAEKELVLKFESAGCRQGLVNAAKKMCVSLVFAEQAGALYVKLKAKVRTSQLVLDLIREKASGWTRAQLVQEFGVRGVALDVDAELRALSSVNLIRLNGNSHWVAVAGLERA